MNLMLVLNTLTPMLIVAVFFWAISLIRKDVSIVDSLWSVFFIISTSALFFQIEMPSLRAQIVTLLVVIWGLRLSLYITIRHWGHEEDHRYQTIRANNEPGFNFKSLYLIFLFQAALAWIIAMPLFFSVTSENSFSYVDLIGISFWLVGMIFESVADYQLWKFKKNPENAGKILTTGLWKYTRHPNYFGEFMIWWGYFCFAWSAGAWFTIFSPLIMTFLLMKFSGVGLLEQTMKLRPGYEKYMKSTNAFFPGCLRKDKTAGASNE